MAASANVIVPVSDFATRSLTSVPANPNAIPNSGPAGSGAVAASAKDIVAVSDFATRLGEGWAN